MGRKRIYRTENLEIGQKIELSVSNRQFKDQYVSQFNARESGKKFKATEEGKRVFIERVE